MKTSNLVKAVVFLSSLFAAAVASSIGDCNCTQFSLSSTSMVKIRDKAVQYVCVSGHDEITIGAIWADVQITAVTEPPDRVQVVTEKSCEKVIEKHKNETNSFRSWLRSFWTHGDNKTTTLFVSPYGRSCFALYVNPPTSFTSLEVKYRQLNILYPVAMVIGLVLFFMAAKISRSILFYYAAGVSLGMIMAVFLLLFILSKFIPKRGLGYAFMFCGSSLVMYFFQSLFNHLFTDRGNIMDMYWILVYFCVAGVISFLYCYYRGPIESSRGLDIMRWSLQSVALLLVYYSLRCEKISFTVTLMLISTKWISLYGCLNFVRAQRWIPHRMRAYFDGPRFISMEEYEKQGAEETAKALKELRGYFESPQCNTWRTMSRLKSPQRFASFMADGLDVTQDEREAYDKVSFDCLLYLTSDEDSQDELILDKL